MAWGRALILLIQTLVLYKSFTYLKLELNKALDENSFLSYGTCHMGSHSDTCHPIQVNAHRLNPSQ